MRRSVPPDVGSVTPLTAAFARVDSDPASEDHHASLRADRTHSLRTDRPRMWRGVYGAADGSPVQYAGSGSADDPASHESVRTEHAHPAEQVVRAPLAPSGWARMFVADRLKLCRSRRKNEGNDWATKRALALTCKLDERIVRQWCDGQKALPVAALLVLPAPLATDILTAIQDHRALTPHRRGLPMLADALARLETPVAADDRDEVLTGLLDAQRVIGERIAKLAREGR